jgi:multiple sugar transport system substrate-binding protein
MFGPSPDTTVVTRAAADVNANFQLGPNYATMFAQMQKLWPQVLGKKLKAADMLAQLQKFTVDDLKAKGINATES